MKLARASVDRIALLLAAAGTAGAVPGALAQGTLYGSDVVTDQLVIINPGTVSGVNVGPLAPMAPSFALTGLAADPATNTIYGISANPPSIWTVNPATGAATLHTSGVFPNNANGLAFDPATNRLFVAELNNNALSTFNIATGQATLVATITGASEVEGLGYDPATQTLYGLCSTNPAKVVKINTTTGAATLVATLIGGTWRGLDFDQSSGMLYATAVGISELTRINPATGQVTNLGAVAGIAAFVQGLAWMGEAPTPCYPDCSGDGSLTVADFGCFQTKFVAGDVYADCNGTGGLTVSDFGCFQTKFVAGCP